MTPSPDSPRRGPLFYVLLVALAVVWGVVGYQVVQSLTAGPDAHAPVAAALPARSPEAVPTAPHVPLPYRPDFPDPFRIDAALFAPPPAPTPPDEAIPAPAPAAPEKPPLTLTGIVGTTALLTDAHGTVHFGEAGTTVADAEVLAVHADAVLITFAGHRHTLHLQR